MKKPATVFACIVDALALVTLVPISAYAGPDTIFSKIVPSETQAVDTSGPAFVATPSTHYMDVYAAGSIVSRIAPSEIQKLDTGLREPQAVAKAPGNQSGKCADC